MKHLVFVIGILVIILAIPIHAQTIPEEAKKLLSEGIEIIEKAKGFRNYLDAEEKFEKAVVLAPEWADVYYNLALVSEELGKEVKAIKSYQRYLELSKDPPDKAEVLANIERLKRAKDVKREIGLAGINFITLKDGIYLRVLAGSKLAKAGFQTGDKIIEVNKRSTVGIKLDEFYKLMQMTFENLKIEDQMLLARIKNYGKNTGINQPIVFQIIRGGKPQQIVASYDTFKTRMFEIEEAEIDEEVLKSEKPVLLIFWVEWCSFCRELIPIIIS